MFTTPSAVILHRRTVSVLSGNGNLD